MSRCSAGPLSDGPTSNSGVCRVAQQQAHARSPSRDMPGGNRTWASPVMAKCRYTVDGQRVRREWLTAKYCTQTRAAGPRDPTNTGVGAVSLYFSATRKPQNFEPTNRDIGSQLEQKRNRPDGNPCPWVNTSASDAVGCPTWRMSGRIRTTPGFARTTQRAANRHRPRCSKPSCCGRFC